MPRRRGVYGLILVSSYILNSANSVLLLMNTTCLHSMRLVEHLMKVIHRVIPLLNILPYGLFKAQPNIVQILMQNNSFLKLISKPIFLTPCYCLF